MTEVPEAPNVYETKEGPYRWNYDYYREYMRALAKGPEYVLPTAEFPYRIEISRIWHSTLDRQRRDSEDGIERYSLAGLKRKKIDADTPVILQTLPAIGLPDEVPVEVLISQLKKVKKHDAMTDVVGDIHSHPEKLAWKIWGPVQISKPHTAYLSDGDLFGLSTHCRSSPLLYFRGVVQGNNHLFAFRTRENIDMEPRETVDRSTFIRRWRSAKLKSWDMNRAIAASERLVLYRGNPGEDLVKVFPPKWLAESWKNQ